MNKTKKYLFIAFLLSAVVICAPIAFAKADNANNVPNNANKEQVNADTNNNSNGDQADIQAQNDNTPANANENKNNNSQINGEKHRSSVSTFVQKLLDVADREQGGIGEQVRAVAKEQNDSKDKVADVIDKVKNRNAVKTFLIGNDYKNLGALRSEMVQTRNRLEQLNRLMENVQNQGDKTELQNQIQALEQERAKIESFIKSNENKFSLFGWLAKLLNK